MNPKTRPVPSRSSAALLAGLALLLLPAFRAVPAVAGEAAPASGAFRQLSVGDHFACDVPADWGIDEGTGFGLSQDEKKVWGVTLDGPGGYEVPVRIRIHYYGEGNIVHRTADLYVNRFSEPVLGGAAEGDPIRVATATVGGRKARVFERTKNEFVPMRPGLGDGGGPSPDDPRVFEGAPAGRREMMARPVPVRERFVVVPAKAGFYALRYTAPAERFEEFAGIFGKVTASFKPLR